MISSLKTALFLLILCSSSALAQPTSVKDFYDVLPNRFFPLLKDPGSRTERDGQLERSKAVIDLQHGYLQLSTVRSEGRIGSGDGMLTVDVFRKQDHSYVVAAQLACPGDGSVPLAFFAWKDGKLVDVTQAVGDLGDPGEKRSYRFVLPREGTTIHGFRDDEPWVDMLWNGDKFTAKYPTREH